MVQGVRGVVRFSGCAACQASLLRRFTTIPDILLSSTQLPSRSTKLEIRRETRLSSTTHQQLGSISWKDSQDDPKSLSADGGNREGVSAQFESETTTEHGAVPWYLKVAAPIKTQNPLSDRQQIPTLPALPPPILQPLLQHISIELGLDDLSLLDLRKLDPPPALGANLLMIIGTARSEKHLHVSADRLCRWLRSEYKLRPDADGLLGRNELKLKMKRKNRRAKLLGSGTTDENVDDGVRTGWVCVNVGTVESPLEGNNVAVERKDYIGFGRQTEGVKIVVQMLVEEKREELDLERLWNGIASRQTTPDVKAGEESAEMLESFPDSSTSQAVISTSRLARARNSIPGTSFSPMALNSRGLHTSARRFYTSTHRRFSAEPVTLNTVFSDTLNLTAIQHERSFNIASGRFDAAEQSIHVHRQSGPDAQSEGGRTLLLDSLKSHLEKLPPEQALLELGEGSNDHSSTSFLSRVDQAIPRFPSAKEWEFRVWLHCFAQNLGHLGYNSQDLMILFDQIQMAGVNLSQNTYLDVIRTILSPDSHSTESGDKQPGKHQLTMAIKVLQDLYCRTGEVLTEDICVTLQESIRSWSCYTSDLSQELTTPRNASIATCDLPTRPRSELQRRLDTLMSTFHLEITSETSRIRLLNVYATQHHWEAFWKLWRSVARKGRPRSAALYACMFDRVAETQHQKGCMNVLRNCIADMDREVPEVKLEGKVLEAVRACLDVADPPMGVENLHIADAKGEWAHLRRRCVESEA